MNILNLKNETIHHLMRNDVGQTNINFLDEVQGKLYEIFKILYPSNYYAISDDVDCVWNGVNEDTLKYKIESALVGSIYIIGLFMYNGIRSRCHNIQHRCIMLLDNELEEGTHVLDTRRVLIKCYDGLVFIDEITDEESFDVFELTTSKYIDEQYS